MIVHMHIAANIAEDICIEDIAADIAEYIDER